MTLREALRVAADQLAPVSDTPRLDAEILAAHCFDISRDTLLLSRLDGPVPPGFDILLNRRLAHEPVAYIIGQADFWTLSLHVGPGVLIPRPDSETLIEAALEALEVRPPATILDLGTGSGALLLAALAEWPMARGLGIDRSEQALDTARRNAASLGLAGRAAFQLGDWGEGVSGPFDLILCNPPYIAADFPLARNVAAYEPASALFAGPAGLDDYHRLAPQIASLLAPAGVACVEIGYDQAETVSRLFAAQQLDAVLRRDLGRRARCLVLRKSG